MSTTTLIWSLLQSPPPKFLKRIEAGRLKGKSDINPQWRYKAMTEVFGPCGIGWKFEIKRMWTEPGPESQVFCFVELNLYIKQGDTWSCPIPGVGGSMLVEKEKAGLHANDEAYKMAVTDALSTSMKMIGVAAEVYLGNYDGSKYIGKPDAPVPKVGPQPPEEEPWPPEPDQQEFPPTDHDGVKTISDAQQKRLFARARAAGWPVDDLKAYLLEKHGVNHTQDIPWTKYDKIIEWIDSHNGYDSQGVAA